MPFYQFTVPAGSATARKKAEVAAAVTAVHAQITGAPPEYVNCSFTEVPPGSIFAGGRPAAAGLPVSCSGCTSGGPVAGAPGIAYRNPGDQIPTMTCQAVA